MSKLDKIERNLNDTKDQVAKFIYILLDKELPAGRIEDIIQQIKDENHDPRVVYSKGMMELSEEYTDWLSKYNI